MVLNQKTDENNIMSQNVCDTLTSHISSVRCLQVCDSCLQSQHSREFRKLIFSGGGRAQLKIWRTDVRFPNTSGCRDKTNCEDVFTIDKSVINHYEKDSKLGQDNKDKVTESECKSTNETNINYYNSDNFGDGKFMCEYVAGLQLSELSGRKVKKPWKYPVENSDPETRILDLTVITLLRSRSLYLIAAACSDGHIR